MNLKLEKTQLTAHEQYNYYPKCMKENGEKNYLILSSINGTIISKYYCLGVSPQEGTLINRTPIGVIEAGIILGAKFTGNRKNQVIQFTERDWVIWTGSYWSQMTDEDKITWTEQQAIELKEAQAVAAAKAEEDRLYYEQMEKDEEDRY